MTPSRSPDALSGLAPLLRVRPELESLCRFGAQWALPHEISSGGWAPFHLVAQGRCVIEVAGTAPIPLETGDVAVLPHGGAHTVRGATTPASLARTADLRLGHTGAILVKTNVEAEPETELVCGRLLFERAHQNLILATLPAVIVLRTWQDPDCERLRQLMAAISDELDMARPGAAAISADLASALLVMVLRAHLAREPAHPGLAALLGQRQSARTLARLFQKTAGMAPLAFLTELRLGLARRKLLAGTTTLAAIAAEVGYQSDSTFSRAFQRRFGMRPGEARRSAAADASCREQAGR
jgi:AraC family transcriptional activator of mtrCDE